MLARRRRQRDRRSGPPPPTARRGALLVIRCVVHFGRLHVGIPGTVRRPSVASASSWKPPAGSVTSIGSSCFVVDRDRRRLLDRDVDPRVAAVDAGFAAQAAQRDAAADGVDADRPPRGLEVLERRSACRSTRCRWRPRWTVPRSSPACTCITRLAVDVLEDDGAAARVELERADASMVRAPPRCVAVRRPAILRTVAWPRASTSSTGRRRRSRVCRGLAGSGPSGFSASARRAWRAASRARDS